MIIGIGVDIVRVCRFTKWYETPSLIRRFFHSEEYDTVTALSKARAVQSLAARFAAKEAFVKALGVGFHGIALADICVHNDSLGKPVLYVYGSAQEALEKTGASRVLVSLSHETDAAVAFVVLERD
ncbi:MAG TPA: holo-ACP synthase [Candidatus Treponema faecavium]|nr:holo-ACP synthase [Candidatus Treponema faecavium]